MTSPGRPGGYREGMDDSPAPGRARPGRSPEAQSLWALAVPVVGAVLSGIAAARAFGPAERGEGSLLPLLGALALTAGGWSLLRLLQLLRAAARAGAESSGTVQARASSAELHRTWLLGVAGSLGLMGMLGLWSLADGGRSGLEPGWPLLLGGTAVALAAQLLCTRVQALAARWEQRRQRARHGEHLRRLEDPLARIRQASARERELGSGTGTTAGENLPPQDPGVTGASSDSRPGSGPSSAGTR